MLRACRKAINCANSLSIAAGGKLDAEHVDVDADFLFPQIEDNLYIKQPDKNEDKTDPNKVCRLPKSLIDINNLRASGMNSRRFFVEIF